jgi:hypothetical protein
MNEMRYGFGKNWEEFVKLRFSEERLKASLDHMLWFLGRRDLQGQSFLDIGSGSGLHSLAAFRAGARRIHSFDYDPDSVRTTLALREMAGNPAHWTVEQGSVLDPEYMRKLEPADIAYSWGVLHHTGEMWKAIENAAIPIAPNGVFYIALYTSDVFIKPSAQYWLDIKRRYNQAGAWGKRLMEYDYAWRNTIFPSLVRLRNPLPVLLGRNQTRGMSYWTDVKDWLGGWPMEFAGIAETKAFAKGLGLELLNVNAGEANTEYLFRRKGASNYWDALLARPRETLKGPFERRGAHAYVCRLGEHAASADSAETPRRSRLMLYEDGKPVGFAHQPHLQIEMHGGGRYSHWHDTLIFSATDGSDPNSNGRPYSISFVQS